MKKPEKTFFCLVKDRRNDSYKDYGIISSKTESRINLWASSRIVELYEDEYSYKKAKEEILKSGMKIKEIKGSVTISNDKPIYVIRRTYNRFGAETNFLYGNICSYEYMTLCGYVAGLDKILRFDDFSSYEKEIKDIKKRGARIVNRNKEQY